jgi:hypothetical protein
VDKDTRNGIERATQAARGLIEQDFADQLAGVFDIRLDGTRAAEPGSHLDAAQRAVRRKLMAAVEHFRSLVVSHRSSAGGRCADDRGPMTGDQTADDRRLTSRVPSSPPIWEEMRSHEQSTCTTHRAYREGVADCCCVV